MFTCAGLQQPTRQVRQPQSRPAHVGSTLVAMCLPFGSVHRKRGKEQKFRVKIKQIIWIE